MGAAAGVAAVGAVASVGGSMIQGNAAGKAASSNAQAQNNAIAAQNQQYQTTRADLQPFVQAGYKNLEPWSNYWQGAQNELRDAYTQAQQHIPGPMDQKTLENTPGYKFNLAQGTKAVQNSAASRGLGVSGSAMQGAANYATGLADSTYQNQFNNLQSIYGDYMNLAGLKGNQLGQVYNMMGGPVTLGEQAAAQTGQFGANAANQNSQSYSNIGQGNAAGATAQGAASAGALNSIGNAGYNYLGLSNYLQNNGGGSGGGSGFSGGSNYNDSQKFYDSYNF